MSRTTSIVTQLVTAFQGITSENGYRNDVANVCKVIRPPDVISSFPEIGIELGKSSVVPIDEARGVFDELVEVILVGTATATTDSVTDPESVDNLHEATESLVHDIKKKLCTDLLDAEMTDSLNPWNVVLPIEIGREYWSRPRNIGRVIARFRLRIRVSDETMGRYLLTEGGGILLTEAGVKLELES